MSFLLKSAHMGDTLFRVLTYHTTRFLPACDILNAAIVLVWTARISGSSSSYKLLYEAPHSLLPCFPSQRPQCAGYS